MGLDEGLLRLIAEHRDASVTAVLRQVAGLSTRPVTYLCAVVLCVVFARLFRAWRPAVAAPVAAVAAFAVAGLVKDLIGRPRPPHDLAVLTAGGFAMPSSIAAMTSAAAVPVILFGLRTGSRAGRLLAAVLTAATLGLGVCMVYLGAHWLTDVLAGWVLGAAIGAGAFRLIAGRVSPPSRSAAPRPDGC